MPHSEFSAHQAERKQSRNEKERFLFKIGYYRPTFDFQCIDEFMSIIDQNGQWVALTGPSTSRAAALNAKLFANAPFLLQQLQSIHTMTQQGLEGQKAISQAWLDQWLKDTEALLTTLENCLS